MGAGALTIEVASGDNPIVDRLVIEALEPAVEALNNRELEPFVGLMVDDMVWRGQPHRWLWWRDAPDRKSVV